MLAPRLMSLGEPSCCRQQRISTGTSCRCSARCLAAGIVSRHGPGFGLVSRDSVAGYRSDAEALLDPALRLRVFDDDEAPALLVAAAGRAGARFQDRCVCIASKKAELLSHAQSKMMPPSTLNDWPVMLRAPGEARKTASAAMSSGSFGRPSGMAALRRRSISSTVTPSAAARVRKLASESAVSVVPGQMAFTLMLCGASWRAAMRVILMTAPLLPA